jgi:hypothetical protein
MKFGLWTANGALNSKPVFEAFATGVQKLGHKAILNQEADVEVIWSILWHGRMRKNQLIWNRCKTNKKPIIVLEIGCFRRGYTWKLGINGINRDAFFGPNGNDTKRADKIGLVCKDWKKSNKPILLAGQHANSGQWHTPADATKYYVSTIQHLKEFTDKKIIFRPHPRSPIQFDIQNFKNVEIEKPNKKINTYDDYDLNVSKYSAVVNWSSNPGIQSIFEGIPAFVGESSLAYDVANKNFKNINNPTIFDTRQWLNDIAYTEWTIEEISTGDPLNRLMIYLKDCIIEN